MKRFLAVLLSLILAAGSLFVAAFAADGKKEKVYPVILLQGYSGPKLFNQDTGEKAWGLDFDKVKEHVLNDYGEELANGDHRDLHPFPTRPSSDLQTAQRNMQKATPIRLWTHSARFFST